jgi:hypothetical protein
VFAVPAGNSIPTIIHTQVKGSCHSSQPITAPSLSHCLDFISSDICTCMQSREGNVVRINSERFSFFFSFYNRVEYKKYFI